jgi:hypothetical protein
MLYFLCKYLLGLKSKDLLLNRVTLKYAIPIDVDLTEYPEKMNIQRSPGSPPFLPNWRLEALSRSAAVAHMIFRLLDLSTPPPFSWGGRIFL